MPSSLPLLQTLHRVNASRRQRVLKQVLLTLVLVLAVGAVSFRAGQHSLPQQPDAGLGGSRRESARRNLAASYLGGAASLWGRLGGEAAGSGSGSGSGDDAVITNAAGQLPPAIAAACSPEYRSSNARAVHNGSAYPALMQWGCEGLQGCGPDPVWRLIESYRQRGANDFLEFVPCDLYKAIQGRTLWLIGDSQNARFYRALRCFLGGPFLERCGASGRPVGLDAPFTDDRALRTVLEDRLLRGYTGDEWGNQWKDVTIPLCTHLLGNTRICHGKVHFVKHFSEMYLPNLRLLNVSRDDIIVINFGLWHHPSGRKDYLQQLEQLAQYYRAHRKYLPLMVWRETSLQHFNLASGEFPNPGEEAKQRLGDPPYQCVPLQHVRLRPDGALEGANGRVMHGGWRNAIASPLLAGSGMAILPAWNETVHMHDMHEGGECTHWCTPGGYEVWVWELWRLLQDLPRLQRQQHGKGGDGDGGVGVGGSAQQRR